MKLKALIFVLGLPIFLVVIEGCGLFCSDSCCGQSFEQHYFTIDGVQLFSESEDTVKYDELEVYTSFDRTEIAQRFFQLPNFTNTAYGCSPPLPQAKDVLLDINVIANTNYSAEYQAGDTLNDIITVFYAYSNSTKVDLSSFLTDFGGIELWSELAFGFSAPPTETVNHAFTVEFVFDNKVISNTTELITITP